MGAVGDDEDLHILIEPAGGPETVPLVPLDLVECLPDGHAPALELHMDQGQTVDQDGHIIAGIAGAAVLPQHLHMVGLDAAGLFHDAVVGSGDAGLEEPLPLAVRKLVAIE